MFLLLPPAQQLQQHQQAALSRAKHLQHNAAYTFAASFECFGRSWNTPSGLCAAVSHTHVIRWCLSQKRNHVAMIPHHDMWVVSWWQQAAAAGRLCRWIGAKLHVSSASCYKCTCRVASGAPAVYCRYIMNAVITCAGSCLWSATLWVLYGARHSCHGQLWKLAGFCSTPLVTVCSVGGTVHRVQVP